MANKKYFSRPVKEYMENKDLLTQDMQKALRENPDDAKKIKAQFKDASEKLEDIIARKKYSTEMQKIENNNTKMQYAIGMSAFKSLEYANNIIHKSAKRAKLILLGCFFAMQACSILGSVGAVKEEKRGLENKKVDKTVVDKHMHDFRAEQQYTLLMVAVSEILLLFLVGVALSWNRKKIMEEIEDPITLPGDPLAYTLYGIVSKYKMKITKEISSLDRNIDVKDMDALCDIYMRIKAGDETKKQMENLRRNADLVAIIFSSLSGDEIRMLIDCCLDGRYEEVSELLEQHISSSPDLVEIISTVVSEKGSVNLELLKKVSRSK